MNEFSKNIRFALVIAEYPKGYAGGPDKDIWKRFVYEIQEILRPPKTIEQIHDNVWLIPLESELITLSEIVQLAKERTIPLRVAFLEESPKWIKYPPDAKTT